MKNINNAIFCEIRIKGYLGQNLLIWFENFDAEFSPEGETILRGSVVDQAAVEGVLTRICDLGLELTLFIRKDNEQ